VEVAVSVDDMTGQLQWDVEVTDTTAGTTVTVSSENDNVLGRERGVDYDYYGIALHKEENGGLLWVDVYTDFTPVETATSIGMWESVEVGDSIVGFAGHRGELNGRTGRFDCRSDCYYNDTDGDGMVTVVVDVDFTPVTATYSGDPDYLAGGIWVYAPDDAAGTEDYEFGAFVDGSELFTPANLAALTGTAEYAGEATGVYTDSTTDTNSFFDADVSLTANFDDADEEISGTISGFEVDGDPVEGDPMLMLETAGIEITNFFTGDTSMTFDGDDFTGKWGGQFYGNGANAADHPGSVAGTFGGATVDGDKAFLGVFGAHR
jgi:hypothetical protein